MGLALDMRVDGSKTQRQTVKRRGQLNAVWTAEMLSGWMMERVAVAGSSERRQFGLDVAVRIA